MKLSRLKEIIQEELLRELEFTNKDEFQAYASNHDIRDTTKVTVGGAETTAGALKGTSVKNPRSHKPKSAPGRPNPEFVKKFKKYKLNAYPPMGVNPKEVKINVEGDVDTHAVLSWKDPVSGRSVSAYTHNFMQRNANIKWSRIEKIKPEYVDNILKNSIAGLKNQNSIVQEASCITAIIAKTGLRPGSRKGFKDTGNRGVSTLGPENVKIEGNKVILNFVGKSYQENNAEFEDPEMAVFLKKKLKEKKGQNFLFDANERQVRRVFKTIGKSEMNIKIKDLRTFTATKMAKDVLENNPAPPKPLPKKQSEIKPAVKSKLDLVFNQVSNKLNNTPAMAKSSYVHPKVIENWLEQMGLEPAKYK